MPTKINDAPSFATESCLSLDAFIRSLAINQHRPICVLLGAGASLSSGMPTAQRCIWEWKQDIFVTNNPTLREQVGELSLPGTKVRIQRWLDQRGNYPPLDHPSEYSFYAKACYPTGQDRRSYFQSYVAKAKPHTGYRLLALLGKANSVRTVWTTNFDGLVARACASENVSCIEVGIDTPHRTSRQHNNEELRLVSMHGDYRYDELKNTDEELKNQESTLQSELLHELKDHDLVVVGYSGRDESLMRILSQSLQQPTTRIFWCGYGHDIPDSVSSLISTARHCGKEAFYIPTEGFDDLISRIALRQFDGEKLALAKDILEAANGAPSSLMAFSAPPLPATTLVKSNAYPLFFPREAVRLDLVYPEGVRRREWVNEKLSVSDGVAVVMEDGALAISDIATLRAAFGNAIARGPVSVAISESDANTDGRIQSLLRRALILGISKQIDVESDGERRIWEKRHYDQKSHQNTTYTIHKALAIRIEAIEGTPHVVLMPEVVVKDNQGQIADTDARKVLRNLVYGYQHNDVFNNDLSYWTGKLTNIDIPSFAGTTFKIGRVPVFAGLAEKGKAPLRENLQRHAKQTGIVIPDANLIFSSRNGLQEVPNPNPLSGLVQNRPWDFQLTCSGLTPNIEIAAICPEKDAIKLKKFLLQFQERSEPKDSERDYLQDYPGFTAAFGIPLICANPDDPSWVTLNDQLSGDPLASAKQLAQRICRALDTIRAQKPAAVVAIFVPTKWAPLHIVETEAERFNLHDYVKAYAARSGQSTQFIREQTTITPQPCRVRWWLSLALYAKALRTPWRIDSLDDDTAFVGIGYSIDHLAERGNHILLGCSHLYSGRGEGLQFRLGRIDSPVIRGRNAFMSEDDARRTGETIRQLFYEAKMRLPSRVVIHKRTPFTNEEQRGLLQGLDGVSNVELIEINIEESLRYLASKISGESGLEIAKFPIQRGAVVIQNSNSALLWVHGSAPSMKNPKFKYYQGKRRIPAPLLVRRYQGQSDIVQVATEILGLSKMNWNTFDYYSQLPATLASASAIAKVGPYLSGFGSAPYDYRLLI